MTPLEALRQELAPLMRRLLRRYDLEPTERVLREAALDRLLAALLTAYNPVSGVPLRPYLVRQLARESVEPWNALSPITLLEDEQAIVDAAFQAASEDKPSADLERNAEMFSTSFVVQWLPEAIALLPDNQRRAFLWHYYEECSLQEMAERLNISEQAVRGLLDVTLTHLRQSLTPAPFTPGGPEEE